MNSIKLLIPILALLLSGCKKDKEIIPPSNPVLPTAVTFNFKALFNNEPLIYNRTKLYTNTNGDSLSVYTFNYYISNIILKKNDGTFFKEPESYHIIKHDVDTTTTFTIKNMPEGNYDQIEFLIGVDSTRNVSGAQTGALSVANGMFWDWNTGYVFFKIEGTFKTSIQTTLSDYAIHVGGFSFPNNNNQKCVYQTSPFGLKVENGKNPAVFYTVTLDEIFKNPYTISLDLFAAVSGNKQATTMAHNYADMFTIDRIEN